jgi:hypothetical protein
MATARAESAPFRARAGTLLREHCPGTEFTCSLVLFVSISHHFANKYKDAFSAAVAKIITAFAIRGSPRNNS